MIFSVLLQIATTVADSASETEKATGVSLFDLLMKGSYIMIPIFLLSALALYIFIERFLYISNAVKYDKMALTHLHDAVSEANIERAKSLCNQNKNAVFRILEKGIARLGHPMKEIESGLEQRASIEIAEMENKMPYLSVIAAVAPMLGFLGTVTGMITAFQNIALHNNISIGIIAEGIYVKMVSSAAGLVVGILAYLLHAILNAKVDGAIKKIEEKCSEFSDLLYNPS